MTSRSVLVPLYQFKKISLFYTKNDIITLRACLNILFRFVDLLLFVPWKHGRWSFLKDMRGMYLFWIALFRPSCYTYIVHCIRRVSLFYRIIFYVCLSMGACLCLCYCTFCRNVYLLVFWAYPCSPEYSNVCT